MTFKAMMRGYKRLTTTVVLMCSFIQTVKYFVSVRFKKNAVKIKFWSFPEQTDGTSGMWTIEFH